MPIKYAKLLPDDSLSSKTLAVLKYGNQNSLGFSFAAPDLFDGLFVRPHE